MALESEKQDVEPAWQAAFDYETSIGKNAVDAAALVPNLEWLSVSSLGSASRGSGGKYPRSLHAEAKLWIIGYI